MKITNIKMQRFLATALCSVCAVSMFALPLVAQDRGDRDRRDREDRRDRDYRRDRDSRDRDLEREKWKQNFDLKGYLEKLDSNKSGVLESKELESDRTRQFLAKLGINTSNPVKIDAAVKKAKDSYANQRDAERKKFEDQVSPKLKTFGTETETTGLAAFGASETKEPKVATFDERLSGLKKSDFEEKTLKDARQMLDGYDRDKSGFLEGDEINRVRWKDPKPAESDLNNDGRISLLEMAQRLQDKSAARAQQSERDYDRRDKDYDRRDRDYDRRDRDSDRNSYRSSRTSASESSRTSTSTSSGSRASKGKSTKGSSDENAYASYIDGVYKKYDTDGDNRLSPKELKKMRRPLKGDTNRDGYLSKEEATNHIKGDKAKNKSVPNASISNTGDGSDDGGRGTTRKGPNDVASRKYTSSGTKAKSGAKSRGSLGDLDANADGQIQMAEFSEEWDEETLQKFRKTDKNQDGIISAQEWSSRSK